VYFDLTLERLATLVCEELTPRRGFAYLPDPARCGTTISLAFCSPNANKPLHLGHARNMVLGTAIGNLLELAGATVVRSCCLSDYGMHIFKALAAYLRWGAGSTPDSTGEKSDHFVGRFYARFASDPSLDHGPGSPGDLMHLWLEGSAEVRHETQRLARWAESGFDATFAEWQVRFDHRFYETEEHAYIERFLARERQRGRVHTDEAGRLVVAPVASGPAVALTRSDGSPLYMSHMVAAILQRLDVLGPEVDTLMSLTGEEQVVAFRQLGETLQYLGYADTVELRHLIHGLVYTGGKGLSSREGTALTVDHVVGQLASDGRDAGASPMAGTPARRRARAMLAVYLLSRSTGKPIHYSLEDCIRIGTRTLGDVAETLRVSAISPLGDRGGPPRARVEKWMLKLSTYPLILDRAVVRLDPSLLLSYLSDLCHEFVVLNRHSRPEGDAHPAPPTGPIGRVFRPTHEVVLHALGVLNLGSDWLAE
jgi:arginyl-tRNA synthetase